MKTFDDEMKRLNAIYKINPNFKPFSFGYCGYADEEKILLPKKSKSILGGLFKVKKIHCVDIYHMFNGTRDCEKYKVGNKILERSRRNLLKKVIDCFI
jgi:hypothetical protein